MRRTAAGVCAPRSSTRVETADSPAAASRTTTTASDRLYPLLGEALERWAPEAEWAVYEQERRDRSEEAELEDARQFRTERRAERQRSGTTIQAPVDRSVAIEEFVQREALHWLLAAFVLDVRGVQVVGGTLQAELFPTMDIDKVVVSLSTDIWGELWPEDDGSERSPGGWEAHTAEARAQLLAARMLQEALVYPERISAAAAALVENALSDLSPDEEGN